MKCQKCGYTSFDYLSQCRKCGADLATIRDALGFDSAKPAIPFLLGALLRDYDPHDSQKKDLREKYSEIEFGEFELDGPGEQATPARGEGRSQQSAPADSAGYGVQAPVTPSAVSPEATPQPKPAVSQASPEDDLEFDVDFLLDSDAPPASPASAAPSVPSPAASPAAPRDELEIDLSDEDLKLIMSDIGQAPATPRPASPQPTAKPAAGEDDLVIELSEKDLENLLMELEDDSQPGSKKKP